MLFLVLLSFTLGLTWQSWGNVSSLWIWERAQEAFETWQRLGPAYLNDWSEWLLLVLFCWPVVRNVLQSSLAKVKLEFNELFISIFVILYWVPQHWNYPIWAQLTSSWFKIPSRMRHKWYGSIYACQLKAVIDNHAVQFFQVDIRDKMFGFFWWVKTGRLRMKWARRVYLWINERSDAAVGPHWPLVENTGGRTSALCQSHQQTPAGSRHVTCTRRLCRCRQLRPARFLIVGAGGEKEEKIKQIIVFFLLKQHEHRNATTSARQI